MLRKKLPTTAMPREWPPKMTHPGRDTRACQTLAPEQSPFDALAGPHAELVRLEARTYAGNALCPTSRILVV